MSGKCNTPNRINVIKGTGDKCLWVESDQTPFLVKIRERYSEMNESDDQNRKNLADKAEALCNSIQTEMTNYSRSMLAKTLDVETAKYVTAAISNYVFHFGYINSQHSVDKNLMHHFNAEMPRVLASLGDVFKTNVTGVLILTAAARKVDLNIFKKHLEHLASMNFAKIGKETPDVSKDLPGGQQIYLYEIAMIGQNSTDIE